MSGSALILFASLKKLSPFLSDIWKKEVHQQHLKFKILACLNQLVIPGECMCVNTEPRTDGEVMWCGIYPFD